MEVARHFDWIQIILHTGGIHRAVMNAFSPSRSQETNVEKAALKMSPFWIFWQRNSTVSCVECPVEKLIVRSSNQIISIKSVPPMPAMATAMAAGSGGRGGTVDILWRMKHQSGCMAQAICW